MSFDEVMHCLSVADQKAIRDMMALFEDIDRQTEAFSKQTTLRCKAGCGACCENPDVETTVVEVLPLAVYLWSHGLGPCKVEEIRSKISQGACVFFEPAPNASGQGRCGIYAYRPGLCRLFGFAARKDKYEKQAFVTCKVIKENQPYECKRTQEQLIKGALSAPLLNAHSFSVANIDPVLGRKLMFINQAIEIALEKVGFRIQGFTRLEN